jgi:pimeloyl-ACP methyl ester carboxylesterase
VPGRFVVRPRRHLVLLATILVAGLTMALAAGCTVGPSSRPGLIVQGSGSGGPAAPAPTGAAALPPLESAQPDAMNWSDCTGGTRRRLGTLAPATSVPDECAQLTVPLDPSTGPDQGAVRIQLLKVGSGAVPLLVVNDLDGLPGTLYAARLASELPPELLRRFSLIGIDRRGTGASDGVRCVPQDDRSALVGYDPTNTDLSDLLASGTDASDQCVLDLGGRQAALNTWNTADDIEAVRQQLGVAALNAIGHGEGSRVLTVYADRFPAQVGRLVLDGSPDPTLGAADLAASQAASAESTFDAFAASCVNARCPLGSDPRGALTRLVAALGQQPATTPDGLRIIGGTALRAVLAGLADRAQWPTLMQALATASTGDVTGLAALVRPELAGSPSDPAGLDANLASGCNDQPARLTPNQVSATVKDMGGKDPLFGGVFADSLLWCAPWPVITRPLPKPTAAGAPTVLVISTASDPETPQSGTERTAQELVSSVLVSWQGAGHGALGQSSCATSVAERFLIDGQIPPSLTACPS